MLTNLEHVIAFLYPAAKREGKEFVVGNVNGESGKSFSICMEGTLRGLYKDFANGDKGSRNLPKLWKIARGIPEDNHARFFQDLSAFTGQSFGWNDPSTAGRGFDWPRCLADFTYDDAHRYAWHPKRQYKTETVQWLHQREDIGLYRGRISFAMRDALGNVVGVHRWFEQEGTLKFLKSPTLWVIGDPAVATELHIHESVGDLIAMIDRTGWHQDPSNLFFCTRGVPGAKLVAGRVHSQIQKIYLWAQHDQPDAKGIKPNERWRALVAKALGRAVYLVEIPEQHKDLNDWTIAGATTQELGYARTMARLYIDARERTSPPPITYQDLPITFPPEEDRPCYGVYDQSLKIGERDFEAGTYLHDTASKGDDTYPIDIRFCAPLLILARTANKTDGDHGRLLEFKSLNGVVKHWAMPMTLLSGDGIDLIARLLGEGLEIKYKYKKFIPDYISSVKTDQVRACATRTGWYSRSTFVLPDESIGPESIWFQSNTRVAAYAKAGTSKDWSDRIARYATGNPYLLTGICFALSGPLLEKLALPGSALHVHGDSSSGKTTIINASSSCWGDGERYRRTWRATANGLEGTCTQHCDTFLALDEIAAINARELDEVTYFLVNGEGKSRSDRYGEARPVAHWRVAALSTGEESISSRLASVGISIKAGQALRFLEVPVKGAYGVFNKLHGFKNGAELADSIRAASTECYGHAGPDFVRYIISLAPDVFSSQHSQIVESLADYSAKEHGALDAQSRRAARAFATAALAGELAIAAGIVPWEKTEAIEAVLYMFKLWRTHWKAGVLGAEHHGILRVINDAIDRHSDSRFSNLNWTPATNQYGNIINTEPTIRDRMGWWDDSSGTRVYLFTSSGLKEVTREYDFDRVLAAVEAAGAFARKDHGQKSVNTKVPDGRQARLYYIAAEKLS